MKAIILTFAMILSGAAYAGNDNSNGGCQGNCPNTGGTTNNQGGNGGTGYGGDGYGLGVGVGVGLGGSATATGGEGGRGGSGGNAVGLGGDGGSVVGSGNSNNRNDATAISGSVSGAHQSQGQSSTNVLGQSTDASSQNDNRSNASGNATNVNIGGDTYQTKRNAPGIVGGSVFPTASCRAGFGIGGSGAAGGGLLNIATRDKECETVVLAQNMAALDRKETACRLLLTTKTWARAVKADPTLAESCK